jgi:hypothetical protein
MMPLLNEVDRAATVAQGICTNITGPCLRSKNFPENLDNNVLALVHLLGKTQATSKIWKRDVTDAFNDSRIFRSSLKVAEHGWVRLLRQLAVADKSLLGEVLGRLTGPTTAGIMFGVGASAARTEADRQAHYNLRRVILLLFSGEQDMFADQLAMLMTKADELLGATAATSPSSATKGDIFLLFRAIVLVFTPENLVDLWAMVSAELRLLFEDLEKGKEASLTAYTHLQGAKLLDLLLLLKPEEFQLHEWLFVTDTIDAIYPPSGSLTIAAADLVSGRLTDTAGDTSSSTDNNGTRKPWLATKKTRTKNTEQIYNLLGAFFNQLSIRAFEDTYSLETVDMEICRRDLLEDLFSEAD